MKAFLAGYRTAAIILLNTILFLVLAELLAGLVMIPYHATKYDRMLTDSWPALHRAFPDYSRTDVEALARENLLVSEMTYAPWVQFRAPTLNGRFINTANQRRSNGDEGNWRTAMPDGRHLDVYFFGGSTMFGFGVADRDTVPAAFQRLAPPAWNVRAFNYGQPFYYSRQETLLFEQLLRAGHRPNVAVFMDGLNDSIQPGASYLREPFFTPLLQRRMDSPVDWRSILYNLNLTRALKKFGLAPNPQTGITAYYNLPKGLSSGAASKAIAASYLENLQFTQSLCDHYKVRCLFVWQPVPMVHYHAPQDTLSMQIPIPWVVDVYARIAALQPAPENFLNFQDTAAAFSGQPFVDLFHYTPSFQKVLAGRMLEYFKAPPGASAAIPAGAH